MKIIKEEKDVPEIIHDEATGYFYIEDNGVRHGEYLTYEDAQDDIDRVCLPIEVEDKKEYVVCRQHKGRGQEECIMFYRGGRRSDWYVKWTPGAVRNLKDSSIAIYDNEKQAQDKADQLNDMSRKNKMGTHTNWRAVLKWW